MTWLEIFTWFNVGVLALGSPIVFALFVRGMRRLLPPKDGSRGPDPEG